MKKRRDSDIPYAQRLMAKKAKEIEDQRNEAAVTALAIMMCTLSDKYGFGYLRLFRLAQETMRNINDLYSSPDVDIEIEHVRERLRQIGFNVSEDGRIYGTMDENGDPVNPNKRKAADGAGTPTTAKEKDNT